MERKRKLSYQNIEQNESILDSPNILGILSQIPGLQIENYPDLLQFLNTVDPQTGQRLETLMGLAFQNANPNIQYILVDCLNLANNLPFLQTIFGNPNEFRFFRRVNQNCIWNENILNAYLHGYNMALTRMEKIQLIWCIFQQLTEPDPNGYVSISPNIHFIIVSGDDRIDELRNGIIRLNDQITALNISGLRQNSSMEADDLLLLLLFLYIRNVLHRKVGLLTNDRYRFLSDIDPNWDNIWSQHHVNFVETTDSFYDRWEFHPGGNINLFNFRLRNYYE